MIKSVLLASGMLLGLLYATPGTALEASEAAGTATQYVDEARVLTQDVLLRFDIDPQGKTQAVCGLIDRDGKIYAAGMNAMGMTMVDGRARRTDGFGDGLVSACTAITLAADLVRGREIQIEPRGGARSWPLNKTVKVTATQCQEEVGFHDDCTPLSGPAGTVHIAWKGNELSYSRNGYTVRVHFDKGVDAVPASASVSSPNGQRVEFQRTESPRIVEGLEHRKLTPSGLRRQYR